LLNEVSRRREIMLGIFISSYFKIFLLAMLVWEFPMSVIFFVDILLLTSNSMALKGQTFKMFSMQIVFCCCYFGISQCKFVFKPVMTESTMTRCIAVCLIAHLIRFLVGQIFEPTIFLIQIGSLLQYMSYFFRIV
jgi:hypothetical protein